MFTKEDALNCLNALGVTAKVTPRGSGTFFVTINLETTDHIVAYNKSIPIYRKLAAEKLVLPCDGGHVGDHGDGFQTYKLIINLNRD